jgi:hypothetical protein
MMPRARAGHHPKTEEERREYFNTTIRPESRPTSEDRHPIIDTTDKSSPTEENPTYDAIPTRRPSPTRQFLRENLPGIIVLAIIIPFLAWGGHTLYSLNREVGEIRTGLDSNKEQQDNLKIQIDKLEQRNSEQIAEISSDVNRLVQRIDRLVDSGARSSPGPELQKQD